MLTKSQSSVAAPKAKRKRLLRAGAGGACVSPIGGTEATFEVLQDLRNKIDIHGLDVQAQQLLLVLEQPPSVDEIVANVKAAASKPINKRYQRLQAVCQDMEC